VKKIVATSSAITILIGFSLLATSSRGQGEDSAGPLPHRVGLIDMAHIFKNYKKFEILRDDLKGDIQKSDSQAKGMTEEIRQLQKELKSGTLKKDSPEFKQSEDRLDAATVDFEKFRKSAQRDFLRKEAEIYKTVYLEINDLVSQYAEYKNYTLILRFNREGLDDTTDPRGIIQGMNRQIVYHRTDDDITDPILAVLNKKYGSPGGKSTRRSTRRPGGPSKR